MNQKIIIAIAAVIIIIGLIYFSGVFNYGSQNYPISTSSGTPNPQSSGQNQQATSSPAVPAQRQIDVTIANNSSLGKIFVDGNGMTLYTYTKDTPGVSTCYGNCAVNWPPLLVSASPKISSDLIAGKFSAVTRTDGTKQVAYEGMPLYYWFKDVKPGDTNGQGVGGVWFVYKVAADDLSASPTPTPNPSATPKSSVTPKPSVTPRPSATPTGTPYAPY